MGGSVVKRAVASTAVAIVSWACLAAPGTSSAVSSPATVRSGVFLRTPGRHPVRAGATPQADSTNWSGYVQVASAKHTFSAVTDTFVVPTAQLLRGGAQFAADWVGIGGYTSYSNPYSSVDPTLVQDGIQTEVWTTKRGGTRVAYDAWTEILPQAEKPLALTLASGDTVTATVEETSKNRWLMEVVDDTTGASASRVVAYRSRGLSAEAIHERPCVKRPCDTTADYAVLAQTSDVSFDPGYLSVAAPGTHPVLQPLLGSVQGLRYNDEVQLNDVVMEDDVGIAPIATPSIPNAADDGFAVADGPQAPSPPAG